MRRTVTISMSDDMYAIIKSGMSTRACSTVSEYIRLLVRRDREQDPKAPSSLRRLRTANDAFEAHGRDLDR